MPPGANKNKQRARRNIAYQKLTRLHRKIPDLLLLHCLLLLLLLLLHLLPLLLILDSDHLLLLHLGLLHLSLLHLDLLLLHLDLRDDPLALELDLAAPDVDRGGREHGAAAATTTTTTTVAIAVAVVVVVLAMATGRPVGGEAAGPAAAVLVVAVGSAVEAGRQTATAERAATGAALHAAAAGAGSPALLVAIEKERHCGGGWLVGGGGGRSVQLCGSFGGFLFRFSIAAASDTVGGSFGSSPCSIAAALSLFRCSATSISMPAIQSAARSMR